jgi:hypothetical protein
MSGDDELPHTVRDDDGHDDNEVYKKKHGDTVEVQSPTVGADDGQHNSSDEVPSGEPTARTAWGSRKADKVESKRRGTRVKVEIVVPEEMEEQTMPIAFWEAQLGNKVRDSVLIGELGLYVFFLLLFSVFAMAALDVQEAHFGLQGIKDMTIDYYFPRVEVQNQTIWNTLAANNTVIIDPDVTFREVGELPNADDWSVMLVQQLFKCSVDQFPRSPLPAGAPPRGTLSRSLTPFTNLPLGNVTGKSPTIPSNTTTMSSSKSTSHRTKSESQTEHILTDAEKLQFKRAQFPSALRAQHYPVGALRFRMQRVTNSSCTIASAISRPDVSAADNVCYSNDLRTGSNEQTTSPLCSTPNPLTPSEPLIKFVPCSLTTGLVTTTEINYYHCGGYVVDIPFTATCDQALQVIEALQDPACPYFDVPSTRFIAAEFFTYSANLQTYFSSKHILEVTSGGGWLPDEQFRVFFLFDESRTLLVVLDFLFLVFVLYYMVRFLLDWKKFHKVEGRWLRFLADIWILCDLVNIVTFLAVFVLRWLWWSYSAQTVNLVGTEAYPERLEVVLAAYSQMRYAISFNLILSFLKVLKFLVISDRLSIISLTFVKAQADVIGLVFLFVMIITGYAFAGNLLYGSNMFHFSSPTRAFSGLMMMLLGELDYNAMKIVEPVLTGFYFWSFLVLGFFLILNFIVAVVGDAFNAATDEQFVAPLDVAITQTASNVFWSLRCETIILRLKLWRNGTSQQHVENQMLAYTLHGHSVLKQLNPETINIMVTPMQVMKLFPGPLQQDGLPFFLKMWEQFYEEYGLWQETGTEVVLQERSAAITEGVRLALEDTPAARNMSFGDNFNESFARVRDAAQPIMKRSLHRGSKSNLMMQSIDGKAFGTPGGSGTHGHADGKTDTRRRRSSVASHNDL